MPLTVQGKHFHLHGRPHFLRSVTYGPFPPESNHRAEIDLPRIRDAGFDSIRLYHLPDRTFLDCAAANNLLVIPTHSWGHGCDFIHETPAIYQKARQDLIAWLADHRAHPALGALLIGNEIPSDMARWMGAAAVNSALDELIRAAQKISPGLPIGYASFPTTEYLEPPSADFTAFNIYLEDPEALSSYLPRLHHIAGDRPVFLTEFGMDTQRNSEDAQTQLLTKSLQITRNAGLAGATLYAWSDDWFNDGRTIDDWSFGLTRRDGTDKPALAAVQKLSLPLPLPDQPPRFSVIVCTRNGAHRLSDCLNTCRQIDYPDFEIIVVNDGSTDGTAEFLGRAEGIRTAHLPPSGLSAARNHGASIATGEILAFTDDDCQPDPHWLSWLAHTFATTDHAAIGGPNIPPAPDSLSLALTTAAPGAPTHVMIDDTTAEHLPGCHLSVRKKAFDAISGFDPTFHTAGDDVDFCWRLRDAGHTLGFCGASFVWHHRRTTPWRYLKQQMGYGHAEALLFKKHPQRFTEGGIHWEGCVYQGSALGIQPGDFIYSGPTGEAPYQSLSLLRQPARRLPAGFDHPPTRLLLSLLGWLQSHLRPWSRKRHGGPGRSAHFSPSLPSSQKRKHHLTLFSGEGLTRHHLYRHLLTQGWESCDSPDWDLQSGDTFLIAATEVSEDPVTRTFVALSTSASKLPALAAAAGFEQAPR